jgi:hypothetical protein
VVRQLFFALHAFLTLSAAKAFVYFLKHLLIHCFRLRWAYPTSFPLEKALKVMR